MVTPDSALTTERLCGAASLPLVWVAGSSGVSLVGGEHEPSYSLLVSNGPEPVHLGARATPSRCAQIEPQRVLTSDTHPEPSTLNATVTRRFGQGVRCVID
jgi:hypothetical protein